MRRPADCMEEARYRIGERDGCDPAAKAEADQLDARAAEVLSTLTGPEMANKAHLPDSVEVIAFKIAAAEAMHERLTDPRGQMCAHMTDYATPHMVDLTGGYVACVDCVPQFVDSAKPWSADRCDVCGVRSLAAAPCFTPLAFTLGPAAAFGHLCDECVAWLGVPGIQT